MTQQREFNKIVKYLKDELTDDQRRNIAREFEFRTNNVEKAGKDAEFLFSSLIQKGKFTSTNVTKMLELLKEEDLQEASFYKKLEKYKNKWLSDNNIGDSSSESENEIKDDTLLNGLKVPSLKAKTINGNLEVNLTTYEGQHIHFHFPVSNTEHYDDTPPDLRPKVARALAEQISNRRPRENEEINANVNLLIPLIEEFAKGKASISAVIEALEDQLGKKGLASTVKKILSQNEGKDLDREIPQTSEPQLPRDTTNSTLHNVSESVPIENMVRIISLQAAVCRISMEEYGPIGTGFLVSTDVVLTCNHTVPSYSDATKAFFEFNLNNIDSEVVTYKAVLSDNPSTVFLKGEEADFSLVRIKIEVPHSFTPVSLVQSSSTETLSRCYIIGHPKGGLKKISMSSNIITEVNDKVIRYIADTSPGSGGSPIFNDKGQLIGLHHSRVPPYDVTIDKVSWHLREGIRIGVIKKIIDDSGFNL